MPQIELLDEQTIDKIAAGEVVERPSSVVKELVENAIDAKATAVTVEIKDGGTSLIRITDNGCGIEREQISLAFYRHSTSKIRTVDDLLRISSLGFRGEALSSIAAVSQVELITKTMSEMTGSRFLIEGGKEIALEEVGAPNGTTFLIRNLFFNTPARKKFLKTPQTEAGYISDLMEHMALSNPNVSFKFINNGQIRLHTSGNGELKDIIYHIYGRDIAANLLKIDYDGPDFSVHGYVGKPVISRGNRNFESYFINGRYIKSKLIAKSIEDAYHGFMMQHKYPFTVLSLTIDGNLVDVNVHPNKMELRFSNGEQIYHTLVRLIGDALRNRELITNVSVKEEKKQVKENIPERKSVPEPFEAKRLEAIRQSVKKDSPYEPKYSRTQGATSAPKADVLKEEEFDLLKEKVPKATIPEGTSSALLRAISEPAKKKVPEENVDLPKAEVKTPSDTSAKAVIETQKCAQAKSEEKTPATEEPVITDVKQASLTDFADEDNLKLLSKEAAPKHKIIGQLFDTYWLVEFNDKFYMIDQHAAHEKVLFERTMKSYHEKSFTSQLVSPPILLSLTMQEEVLLKKHLADFEKLGFTIEHFGGKEYTVTAVPGDLYGINGQTLLTELIDGLGGVSGNDTPDMVMEKIASMSCKAAVKGNQRLSRPEIEALIEELLELENPYFCPHGRPVIIAMTKYEIEKKFKRIV